MSPAYNCVDGKVYVNEGGGKFSELFGLVCFFFLLSSSSIIVSFYFGENNTHATTKMVETLQFPGWLESGKMRLAVIGLNFFTDNNERSFVKVGLMSCSPLIP